MRHLDAGARKIRSIGQAAPERVERHRRGGSRQATLYYELPQRRLTSKGQIDQYGWGVFNRKAARRAPRRPAGRALSVTYGRDCETNDYLVMWFPLRSENFAAASAVLKQYRRSDRPLCDVWMALGPSVKSDAVGVENVLSNIEADCDWLHNLTSSSSCPKTIPVFGPGDGCRPQHQKLTQANAACPRKRRLACRESGRPVVQSLRSREKTLSAKRKLACSAR